MPPCCRVAVLRARRLRARPPPRRSRPLRQGPCYSYSKREHEVIRTMQPSNLKFEVRGTVSPPRYSPAPPRSSPAPPRSSPAPTLGPPLRRLRRLRFILRRLRSHSHTAVDTDESCFPSWLRQSLPSPARSACPGSSMGLRRSTCGGLTCTRAGSTTTAL